MAVHSCVSPEHRNVVVVLILSRVDQFSVPLDHSITEVTVDRDDWGARLFNDVEEKEVVMRALLKLVPWKFPPIAFI